MTMILAREFASQLHLKLEQRQSYLRPRDRDICADPPLVGGSVLDLAGQANANGINARFARVASIETYNFDQYVRMLLCDLDHEIQVTIRTAVEIYLEHDVDDIDANLATGANLATDANPSINTNLSLLSDAILEIVNVMS
jgi:hypothetical protein